MSLIATAVELLKKDIEVSRKLSKYELSIEQVVVLRAASKLGSPGMIVHEFAVYPATVTHTIDSLEKRGLLTRELSRSDRRKITLRLTDAGETLMQSLQTEAA